MASRNEQPLSRQAQEDDEDIRKGDVVGSGRWEILDGGTRGGMATVFRARDTRTGGEVALKVIARRYIGRFDREKRFENEGRLAARLKGHRNIAAPIETGVLADRANRMYLAMELVRGPTLLDYISMNGPLPVEKACVAIRDIARALRDLHASDVVHRDVTSNNVILVETGSNTHVAKLIDFGLAADVETGEASGDRLTRVGEIPGTPHYMSPEQTWGEAAHPAFDVYALGIVFYEMLVGEPPWHELDAVAVKARKCDLAKSPPSVTDHRRDVPTSIAELIFACLQPRFSDRLPSSGLFVVQLDEIRAQLGYVDPRPGETTGVVGLPRTIDQAKREPKLKQIVADAMAAKEARERAALKDQVTRPVAAPPDGTSPEGDAPSPLITGLTEPATAAMLGATKGRPHKATDAVRAAESGVAAPRISGRTLPVRDAAAAGVAVPADAAANGRSRKLAVLGLLAGIVVAAPLVYWLSIDRGTEVDAGRGHESSMGAYDATPANASGAAKAAAGTTPSSADGASADAVVDDGPAEDDAAVRVEPAAATDGATPDDAGADDPTGGDDIDGGAGPVIPVDSAEDDGGSNPTPRPKPTTGGRPPASDDSAADDASDDDAPSDDGANSPRPTKADNPWTESRCKSERDQAMTDRLAGRFAGVLMHTRVKRCWPSERERLELRVRAFSELGRYGDCVKAGDRATDSGIARMVRRCRKKLDAGG